MLTVNDQLQIPLREFEFTFVRSSGPGGQNVNKVNSKAVLRWDITRSPSLPEAIRTRFFEQFSRRINQDGSILITSQRFRDQGRNTGDCLEKLRQMLATAAIAPTPRKATRPSYGSKQRRLTNKRDQSTKEQLRRRPARDE